LHERGALVAGGKGGYTVPRTVEGGKQRVFALSLPYLSSQISDPSDTEGATPHGDAKNPYRTGANTSDTSATEAGVSDTTSDAVSDDDPIPSQHPTRTEPVVARGNTAVSDVSDHPDTRDAMKQRNVSTSASTRTADIERLRLFAEMAASGEWDDAAVAAAIRACAERVGIAIDPTSERRAADAILAWLDAHGEGDA
jgi:hypothetical protein